MKRVDIEYTVSIILLISITITGVLGYFQSQLELRRFVPHRYSAYITLSIAAVHVYLNIGKIWKFLRSFGKQR
jgi:hypothetical protein